MRKSRLRIKGNDRFLMMLCKDIRRRWMQYGENRKEAQAKSQICQICQKEEATDWDHIIPMGPRPRSYDMLSSYAQRMVEGVCQGLCTKCHRTKTNEERQKRKV